MPEEQLDWIERQVHKMDHVLENVFSGKMPSFKMPSGKIPGYFRQLGDDALRRVAQHRLEGKIEDALALMDGHRSRKVPKGARQYKALWETIDAEITKFCTSYSVGRDKIEAQVPGLGILRDLAIEAPPQPLRLGAMIAIPVGVLAAIALLSVLWSTIHYIWIHSGGMVTHFLEKL